MNFTNIIQGQTNKEQINCAHCAICFKIYGNTWKELRAHELTHTDKETDIKTIIRNVYKQAKGFENYRNIILKYEENEKTIKSILEPIFQDFNSDKIYWSNKVYPLMPYPYVPGKEQYKKGEEFIRKYLDAKYKRKCINVALKVQQHIPTTFCQYIHESLQQFVTRRNLEPPELVKNWLEENRYSDKETRVCSLKLYSYIRATCCNKYIYRLSPLFFVYG